MSPEFECIEEIATMTNSRFMISCGGQMYIDIKYPVDVKTEDHYAMRYTHTWYSKALSNFFANLPQYMILDDHEIFNDFVNQGLTEHEQDWFNWGVKTYGIFQHSHNPDTKDH